MSLESLRRSLNFALLAIGGLCMWPLANSIQAAESEIVAQETREFKILVDGKNAGKFSLKLATYSDGTETMKGESEVTLNYVIVKYHMATKGSEVWKDGHLKQMANEANFNGDKYVVQASATDQTLEYKVNGKKKNAPADIWVSSYWREPEAQKVGYVIQLFDADKGHEMKAHLAKVGIEKLHVGPQRVPATHYALRGDVHVDLWYDEDGRLMRQEDVESGHKSLMEMTRVTKSE